MKENSIFKVALIWPLAASTKLFLVKLLFAKKQSGVLIRSRGRGKISVIVITLH